MLSVSAPGSTLFAMNGRKNNLGGIIFDARSARKNEKLMVNGQTGQISVISINARETRENLLF
jgi:hypothetical protein